MAGVGLGLSPRLRGNLICEPLIAAATRSIPAPAGKPKSSEASPTGTRVYPRACGETSMISKRAER